MSTGTVKFFNELKGFGFVKSDEVGGEEFFFHRTALNYENCQQDDKVSFDVEKSKHKPGSLSAINLQLL